MKQYRLDDRLIYKCNCIRDMKCRWDVCAKWYEPVISQREYFFFFFFAWFFWNMQIIWTEQQTFWKNWSIKKSTKFYMFAINNCKYISEYSRKYQNYFLYIKISNIVKKLYIYIYINLFYSILMYYNTVIIYWRLNIHILVCIYIYIYKLRKSMGNENSWIKYRSLYGIILRYLCN